jgi:hypothetical protein
VSEPTVDQLQAALGEQESRPGDGVTVYVFQAGDLVPPDHPAALAFPHLFESAEE